MRRKKREREKTNRPNLKTDHLIRSKSVDALMIRVKA